MKKTNKMSTQTLVLGAILTALVILLQYVSMWIRFGTFSVTLSLIPIVIGAIVCGRGIGAWLGFVFGVIVLASGDAALFLGFNVPGTVVTVLAKGILCGFFASVTYKMVNKLLEQKSQIHKTIATFCAAIICPIVNTGVFILGCYAFFLEDISSMALDAGMGGNVFGFIITAFVTINFVFELLLNIVATPATIKILKATKKI